MRSRKPNKGRAIRGMIAASVLMLVSAVGFVAGARWFHSSYEEYQLAVSGKYEAVWHFAQYDAQGSVIWQDDLKNALVDGGEQKLLETYFRDATEPTAFYLGLSDADTCSIGETDSLTTAMTGEPSTNGYSRQTITHDTSGWPTSALDSGDWQVSSTTETFSASGGSWGPVNCGVLADSSDNSGEIIAFVALSTARTLADGESLEVSMDVKLQ